MKINITPAKSNVYPKKGILVKGTSPKHWLPTLQLLNIDVMHTTIFPIPSTVANELYGCFIILTTLNDTVRHLNVSVFQSVHNYIYIPEFSKLSPKLSEEESKIVFKQPHIFHPDFGWVTLNESIAWQNLLQMEPPQNTTIIRPYKTVYSPQTIKSFQLIADEEIDIIKALDLKIEPPRKDTLTGFDKAKLKLFESLFSSKKNTKGGFDIEARGLLKWLNKGHSKTNSSKSKWKTDFEKLLFRNQKETDKLLSLFKSNPSLALSKALPLDMLGTSRDAGDGVFKVFNSKKGGSDSAFSKLLTTVLAWCVVFAILFLVVKFFGGIANGNLSGFFFTLLKIIGGIIVVIIILALIKSFAESNSAPGGSVNLDSERMAALKKEYEKLAEEAIKQKDYKKAASIYIKLLKDNYKAADILEDGKFYQEAAVIHLKYSKNKALAAKAYENGKFYNKAITLYKELNQNEKVGDLYKIINNKTEANTHYQIVINNYLEHSQYVKASLVYKYKIEDTTKAQEPLLEGWRNDNDAYNCLNNYFGNFPNTELLTQGIQFIYTKETQSSNINAFLKALKHEHTKHEELQEFTQNIAYEAVANYIKENPSIAYVLSSFNSNNSLLNSDTSKYIKKEKKAKRDKDL